MADIIGNIIQILPARLQRPWFFKLTTLPPCKVMQFSKPVLRQCSVPHAGLGVMVITDINQTFSAFRLLHLELNCLVIFI